MIWPSHIDRSKLRTLQNRIVSICERRNFELDAPISDLQYGCPTANQLRETLWPDYIACMDSFMHEFAGK